ncbi:DUF3179 domain-containing protein [Rhodobacteraceae bacterium 2376]|uniref:DUF3179 domain-containing protein n=1 Tax=Rhabdonatronobacter sediminivivens TaxID=2743469 RepID=A0A7Z0HX18_9RHOB|nr:DUF3179 domain-containing protein [Rhabdonatronobacter sediminivivens]NYS23891.1 DUF3179 domain-containing protein [Rhabdonatronobacter sediminivivens]
MRLPTPLIAAAFAICATAALADPAQWVREWPQTDFTRTTIAFDEVIAGGPPKDGIPAIWAPAHLPAAQETRLDDREPVLTYDPPDAPARAYPIRYLMWHEIVNDVVEGLPIAVTYCPLCNSAMVFDARVDGVRHSFGVSGKLRHSDMIMYDRETKSWWQQAVGKGVVGAHAGAVLTQLPGWMESWAEFRDRNPDGLVMDQPDWRRAYGSNPYVGYDSAARPFLYRGEDPPHGIHPLARVVRVGDRAWTFARLRAAGEIREAGVVLNWAPGQASALDSRTIADGRDVGTVRVRDAEGRDLPHDIPFAFAFHAFFPDGVWMLGD